MSVLQADTYFQLSLFTGNGTQEDNNVAGVDYAYIELLQIFRILVSLFNYQPIHLRNTRNI